MANVFQNLDWSVLIGHLTTIIPALICITFHELAHGFTAYWLGDRTAKEMGRLTLNPIKHIDIFGLIMIVVFKFGWAKPVPVNMHNFKRPKWYMAITAIAGPLSNIILAVVFLFIHGLLFTAIGGISVDVNGDIIQQTNSVAGVIFEIVHLTVYISIALAVFNLMPIPPLDGSKVLFSLLPEKTYFNLMRYERYGIILLIIFVNIDNFLNTSIFGATIGRLTETLSSGLYTVWHFAISLVN